MIDKPPVGMSRATLRIRALQVVAGALIVAAIALIAHGLLTPASPTVTTPGHSTPGVVATATAAPADPLVGHYAPDVTLHDMRDKLTPLSSLRGSVVLLNFWYVSCLPCQIEMPALERAYLAHQAQGFKVVGIDVVDDASTISALDHRGWASPTPCCAILASAPCWHIRYARRPPRF